MWIVQRRLVTHVWNQSNVSRNIFFSGAQSVTNQTCTRVRVQPPGSGRLWVTGSSQPQPGLFATLIALERLRED